MDNRQQLLIITSAALIGTLLYVTALLKPSRRRSWRSTPETIQKLAPVIIAIFASMLPLAYTILTHARSYNESALLRPGSDERVWALENQVKRLSTTVDAIDKQLAQAQVNPKNGVQSISPAALTAIDQRVTQNSESIHKFEQLLVTDASRLVTLPLMQRDFQAVKDDLASAKENIAGLRSLVTETGSQNRWVIGTLALGMLALVVPAVKSLLAPANKKEPEKDEAK